MVKSIRGQEYVEVYEVIKKNESFLEKLPKDIIRHIENKAKKSRYIFNYDETKDIFSQISRNALSLVTYLYLKYVCDDENEKKKMKKTLCENKLEFKKPIKVSKAIIVDNEKNFELKSFVL